MSQQQLDAFIGVVRADPAWQQRIQTLESDVLTLAQQVRQAGYDLSDEEIVWLTTCQDWMSDAPASAGTGSPPLGVWG
ncbi:Nif11-like leader peptide family natural product precursor [Cyanobium sp. FGCU-52]|nr:Nif11-like leader peptide family natural product precursor [Cyanobium sp. FGCU52]